MLDNLAENIITDLTNDFPSIESIEEKDHEIIIKADDDTLWEIYELLYNGMDDVEFNMDKEKESYISIKI